LVEARPRSLLTIGAMHGGVEWHVARRFRSLQEKIRITVVDLAGRSELVRTLEDARRRFQQEIDLVVGDSTSPSTHARLAPKYDAVFIDADHGYRASRLDFELARSRCPRIVGLHDIVDSDWHAQSRCCVSRLWAELRERFTTEERCGGDWGGIGIIRLDAGDAVKP
jgi:predicted O-methyltransferase YrrM